MSLINCPNCGRPNVSDSAENCPECNYNIKAHFEEIKRKQKEFEEQKIIEEQRKQKEIEQKAEEEKQIECPECHESFSAKLPTCPNCGLSINDNENIKRLNEINRLEKIVKQKRDIKNFLFIFLFFLIASIFFLKGYFNGHDSFSGTFAGLSSVFTFLCFIGFAISISEHFENQSKLKLAKEDYDKYLEQKKEAQIQAELASIEKHQKYLNNAQCPYCHSRNTKKISTASRATSVALTGIASKKIGKQWHCNDCGSDF